MSKKEVIYVKQKTSCLTWVIAAFLGLVMFIIMVSVWSGITGDRRSVQGADEGLVLRYQNIKFIPEGFFISGGIKNRGKKGRKVHIDYTIYDKDKIILEGSIDESNILYPYLEANKGTTFGQVVEYMDRIPGELYVLKTDVH